MNRGVFVFLEGPDDERFFYSVIINLLQRKYDWIKSYLYANKKPKLVSDFIRSINGMNVDYIFIGDMDENPCITQTKDHLVRKFPNLENQRIVIVKREIECWYLAGLSEDAINFLKIESFYETDEFTKENFNQKMPRRFASRIDFMIELLKHYSIENAVNRNSSFTYFYNKYFQ